MRPGVTVAPYGGVVVRSPYYGYGRVATPFVSPRLGGVYRSPGYLGYRIEAGTMGLGGVSVTVGRPRSEPAVQSAQPTPASITPSLNEAPAFVAPSLTPDEYEAPADLDSQLGAASQALQARLNDFNGGEGWQKYLALPESSIADPQQREKMLRRMDSVAREAEFRTIADLDEFQSLQQLLQYSLESGAESSTPKKPDAPRVPSTPAEALPTPSPEPKTDNGERSILSPAQP
jgi:hypothetical protein